MTNTSYKKIWLERRINDAFILYTCMHS